MLTLRCSLSQDFLAANRCVGQYLLAVGEGTAGLGAVTVVAYLERGYSAGVSMPVPAAQMCRAAQQRRD